MEVRLLGPLQIWQNGGSITLTAGKHRQAFALLAVRAGGLVTSSELIDELWEDGAPRSAIACLQTYVLKLRQAIALALPPGGTTAKEILITQPYGYTLSIPKASLDVHRYQELVAAGELAMNAGDCTAASRLLGSAMATWRGPALVDVPVGPQLRVTVARLEQSRLGILETRIDTDLQLGRHRQLLDELAELTGRYPMHEKFCTQYMTALHVCGCKWRALEVFWALRQRLVTELGLEPSHEVQRVQRAILTDDTGYQAAAWSGTPAIGSPVDSPA